MTQTRRSFDIDGVITVGIYPGPNDVIITGRSFEEAPETYKMLHEKGIFNAVFFNPLPFDQKTRKSSGIHKAFVLKSLIENGNNITWHFEDDEVQIESIDAYLGALGKRVPIIHVKHDLTEKENVRHLV